MKYIFALEQFLKHLIKKGYSKNEIIRKRIILKKWFSYTLCLYVPDAVIYVKKTEEPIFYSKDKVYTNAQGEKINFVKHFTDTLNNEKQIIYLNLNIFLENYISDYLKSYPHKKEKLNAIKSFCRGIGLYIDMENITKDIYDKCLNYLKQININRAEECTRAFLIFCHENNWLKFNPYPDKRNIYARCLAPDFIGCNEGIWREYLLEHINYLKYENNFGNGGIDYRIRKLKILIKYLDCNKICKPTVQDIKKFIQMKEKDGVKNITLSKYVYEAKYFFNFLIKKGYIDNNPAQEIKIKDRFYKHGDILTEKEVNKIMEMFEEEIYKTKNAKRIDVMQNYFRAVRDNLIFQLFVFTGVRLSEAGNIKIDNIDFNNKNIQIICKGNREVRQKIRNILIDPYLWLRLRDYLKVRNYPGQTYLFITWSGRALSNSRINKIIINRIKQAGINKQISPHRLRATCASLYVKKGMDPITLKIIMGHESIATTIDKYSQLTDDEVRNIWKQTNPLKGVLDDGE